jgi:hypothetical protein
MKNRVDFYRGWEVELITDIFNIPFNPEWTEFFMIKFVARSCYLNISSYKIDQVSLPEARSFEL